MLSILKMSSFFAKNTITIQNYTQPLSVFLCLCFFTRCLNSLEPEIKTWTGLCASLVMVSLLKLEFCSFPYRSAFFCEQPCIKHPWTKSVTIQLHNTCFFRSGVIKSTNKPFIGQYEKPSTHSKFAVPELWQWKDQKSTDTKLKYRNKGPAWGKQMDMDLKRMEEQCWIDISTRETTNTTSQLWRMIFWETFRTHSSG